MNKLILITALLLVLIFGVERYISYQKEMQRILKSELRPLPNQEGKTADMISKLRIERADTAWTYRLQNGHWRYPAYENAFTLQERLKPFVKDLVESLGTVVATEPSPKYGFEKTNLTVHLTDSLGTWKQTIQIGMSLPGTTTQEAYMKVPPSDTVFHVHADPIRRINTERLPNLPPFIDPKVLPSALNRSAIIKVVLHTPNASTQTLERIEIQSANTPQSPTDGPTYEWMAHFANKRQKAPNTSVYAYLGYLSRLKYTALLDPNQMPKTNHYLVLIDAKEMADTLFIAPRSQTETYLHHKTTGHLYSISKNKASLLSPIPTVLDTLPNPSPYQQAEPTGAFTLQSL